MQCEQIRPRKDDAMAVDDQEMLGHRWKLPGVSGRRQTKSRVGRKPRSGISTATPTKSIAPGSRCLGRGFSVIRLSPDRRYFQARGEQCILHNEAQIRRDLAFADCDDLRAPRFSRCRMIIAPKFARLGSRAVRKHAKWFLQSGYWGRKPRQ